MFHKKQKTTTTPYDRVGRTRQVRTVEHANNAAVFSYHANRSARMGATGRADPQTISATAARGKRAGFHGLPVVVGIGLVIVLGLVNLALAGTPHVQVDSDTIAPAHPTVALRQTVAYQSAAEELFSTSLLNKNKVTVNTNTVREGMHARFPELARVTISVPFIGGAPVVHVVPGVPVLLLNATGELYVLDNSGTVLIRASEVPNIEKLDLPVVVDGSGLTATPGKQALPASNVRFITEVLGQLKAKGLTITDINLPAGTSEMDVRVSGAGYIGKFNLQGDGRVEAGAYLAVKAQLERGHTVPASYIDVRVEGRAYYK